ncbi:hypothetical protein AVEN_53730-1 [Araneus ventricosus]|uniref:Protein Abitram n=1 Tax=Araneus ventricosus TaxID=182803 RepID=A0A4Y2SJN5_ARAVE|nr:hypothetical protein AVEN_53730-1 [Araneus ventricosus]
MLQDLPSKFFRELEGLLDHIWPSIVLGKHYPVQELAPVLVLDGLFEPQQHVAVPLSVNCFLYTLNRWYHQKHELPSPHRGASPQPTRENRLFTGDLPDNQVTLHRADDPTQIARPNHPILKENLDVISVKFESNRNVNRLSNKVSGKFKRGGQKLSERSVLCSVKCSDDREYSLYSCISGTLVEVNEKLLENPNLLKEKPWSEGYVGIILPPFSSSRRKNT